MDIRPLTLADVIQWANLLAICFTQSPDDMEKTIHWLHCLGNFDAYGIWDNDTLIAQYACLRRNLYFADQPMIAGMSMNMAVHPDYRGQGLIKQVSRPVYVALQTQQAMLGMGFSNAQGVKVDQNSKSYGYYVVGQMQSLLVALQTFNRPLLTLSDILPDSSCWIPRSKYAKAHFQKDLSYFINRYGHHPIRQYHYGIWQENDHIHGIVVYKKVKLWGLLAVALLDAYSEDIDELLMRWSSTVRQSNIFLLHTLVSPQSTIKQVLQTHFMTRSAPFTRNPYYLTVKPLSGMFDDKLLKFDHWDLIGGDVL